jgi:dimethylhistidine N-methyltransferase
VGLSDINIRSFVTNPFVVADDASVETSIEILQGLQRKQKTLPTKLFYDQRGSLLFEQICRLDEYYPTHTETEIMVENIQEIAGLVGTDSLLIEYGSGSSMKTKVLLDHLHEIAAYVPVDISELYLYSTAENLKLCYPNLDIFPLCADFTAPFLLPPVGKGVSYKLAYFPGSTIGNFHPQEAICFMQNVANLVGPGGGFLIGIDLVKDPEILNLAYNDRKGITAAFNLNILTHINREYHADFVESKFEHLAFYNENARRIEMHLISKENQVVNVNGTGINFSKDESILTEVSYKFTLDGFAKMAAQAGFSVRKDWVDPNHYFSIQYLVVE